MNMERNREEYMSIMEHPTLLRQQYREVVNFICHHWNCYMYGPDYVDRVFEGPHYTEQEWEGIEWRQRVWVKEEANHARLCETYGPLTGSLMYLTGLPAEQVHPIPEED